MKRSLPVLMLAASFCAKAQEIDPALVTIITHEVVPGIFYLEGNGGNIGLSTGDDGVFMIDDEFAPLTEKIRTAVGAISPEPVQFVFNTHFHFDHTDGNENFGAGGALIVAQENARLRMSEDQYLEVLQQAQPKYDAVGLPVITFTDEMTFHFNGHTIHAMHLGPGHTDGDAIVHFVDANVIHTGDVFVRYGLPYIDVPNGGNINGMIRATHQIIAMADDNTKIIPGHGELSDKTHLVAYVAMLEIIRDRVFDGIKAGMSLDEITATIPTRDYPQDGFVNNAAFSKIAYDSFYR